MKRKEHLAQNFAIIQYETEKVTAHYETERAWCTTTERTRVHHKIEWTTVHYRTERTVPLIFHLALVCDRDSTLKLRTQCQKSVLMYYVW